MPNYILVTNLKNSSIWEKQLTESEVSEVRNAFNYGSRSRVCLFPATFFPVRTHSLKKFATDFFLPTTLNYAIKVNHCVGKIFALLAALILDAITFPIRLLTCIPRIRSNAKKTVHPLYRFLKDQNANSSVLNKNYLRVKLGWETLSPSLSGRRERRQNWEEATVNFVDIPDADSAIFSHQGGNHGI